MSIIRQVIIWIAACLCLLGIGMHVHSSHTSVSEPVPQWKQPQAQPAQTLPVNTAADTAGQSVSGLPCPVPESPFTAQALVLYEGPFWEDGTDEETVCAALILENTSDSMIEYARLELLQNGLTLVFEITFLPPHATVMAMEKNRAQYSHAPIESCRCPRLSVWQSPESCKQVLVTPDGACSMIVTNLTRRTFSCVRIYYKHYFPENDIYLGGITYSAVLTDLLPGESRRITPYHYLVKQGSILAITADDAYSQ